MRNGDLTSGNITKSLWTFALPLMFGNVLQQLYNLADTWVVGVFIDDNALAAVGSSYTLMTFLTSIIIGLCLGSSTFISMAYGQKNGKAIRNGVFVSFVITAILSVVIMAAVYLMLDWIIAFMQTPDETKPVMREYLFWVFLGFFPSFLYNYSSNILRAVGNSATPLVFLGISVAMNILLDLLFVAVLHQGAAGAAIATVISQHASGYGLLYYLWHSCPWLRPSRKDLYLDRAHLKEIFSLSGFTCLQQSVMNFGILLVQGLVNSFGTTVMAAFAVAVKIDTIAYMPVQDFGNAFSVFVAQNFGAGKSDRIREGIRKSLLSVTVFCLLVSTAVFAFSKPLMAAFVSSDSTDVVAAGAHYLRIEGIFYLGIGVLFMLYGYYRAVDRPCMSVILTVCSLGTRVVLAYALSGVAWIGVTGIWLSIPIGWFLADCVGIAVYLKNKGFLP